MNRPCFLATLVAAACCLPATLHAFGPYISADLSTVPGHVSLVGCGRAGADSAAGHLTVIVRDVLNVSVPGVDVWWDFSACPDLRLAADLLDPRLTVDCASRTVWAVTGSDGTASFTFVGSGRGGIGHGAQVARVYARVWVFGTVVELRPSVTVSAFDLNGIDGVRLSDLSLWSADFFGAANPSRADYDGDGAVMLADLSIWGAVYIADGSWEPASSYCP